MGACFARESAIRVCQPGPLAFQRSSTTGATLRLMATLEWGDLGRPRGFSNFSASFSPNNSGNSSRAGRARANSPFFHSGFSSLIFDRPFFFISLNFSLVGLSYADHLDIRSARSKDHHMDAAANYAERLVAALTVVLPNIFQNVSTVPFEVANHIKGNGALTNIPLTFFRVVDNAHKYCIYVYTLMQVELAAAE